MRPKRHLQRTEFYGGSATESVHEYDEAGSLTKSDERTYEPDEAGARPILCTDDQLTRVDFDTYDSGKATDTDRLNWLSEPHGPPPHVPFERVKMLWHYASNTEMSVREAIDALATGAQQIVGDGTPREDAEIAQEAASIEASDPAAPEIKIPHVGEEPEPPKGRLPDDFPYLTALHAHEPPINTFTQLAKFAEDYTQILGVGPVGAEAITKAVAEAAEPDA